MNFTDKFLCEPPVTLRSAYNCFNVSIPGAAINITYGINSVLLWSIFNAFGAQSKTHILPINNKHQNDIFKFNVNDISSIRIYLV